MLTSGVRCRSCTGEGSKETHSSELKGSGTAKYFSVGETDVKGDVAGVAGPVEETEDIVGVLVD
jgi:hypothetical protein